MSSPTHDQVAKDSLPVLAALIVFLLCAWAIQEAMLLMAKE